MTGSFSPLRRRLLVTPCKSGVLLDFEDDDVGGVVVDKQHSRRQRVSGKAARLSLSVPAGPACCCVCAAASRKTIIIPCTACFRDGPRRMDARKDVRSRHAECGEGRAWRGEGCSSRCGVTCRGEVEMTLACIWRAAAVGGMGVARRTHDESCMLPWHVQRTHDDCCYRPTPNALLSLELICSTHAVELLHTRPGLAHAAAHATH